MPLCVVGSRGSVPTVRFTYTTYRLPTGTLTVYSISTKAHTNWLRNSFSWHAVVKNLRQKNTLFSIIFATSPLAKSWIRACTDMLNLFKHYYAGLLWSLAVMGVQSSPISLIKVPVIFHHDILELDSLAIFNVSILHLLTF